MATKLDIRSYLNPMKPSWGEAGQREKLTGEIYTTEQREALLRSLRPGSIVEVVETFLLAKTTGRSDARKRDLLEVVDRIEESGALIKELSTGMMHRQVVDVENARTLTVRLGEFTAPGGSGHSRRRSRCLL